MTTTEANKQIVRRYYEELWNGWRLGLAEEFVAPGIRFRGSLGVEVEGREAFLGYVGMVRGAFPDFHNTVEELVAEGDGVAVRLTYRGTHLGELFGIPATGRKVTYTGAAFFRIDAGRIIEGWVLGDTEGLRRQLAAT